MPKKIFAAAILGVSIVFALVGAGPASAANVPTEPDMQQRVEAALAAAPGGVQIKWNEVSWDGGAAVLTLAVKSTVLAPTALVGNCASGKFCVYAGARYTGNKLTYSTCTSGLSVAPLGGPVRSIANSRTSGTVTAYNGTSPVVSVPAGTGKNTAATITSVSCV